jgi:hypothetical protein
LTWQLCLTLARDISARLSEYRWESRRIKHPSTTGRTRPKSD